MNTALWQIAQSYFRRSWLGTAFFLALYGLFTVFNIDQTYMWGLGVSYMVSHLVATRLKSTQAYAVAFSIPDYRKQHLMVASLFIGIFGWMPVLVQVTSLQELLRITAFLTSVTGVVLLGEYISSRWFAIGYFALIGLLALTSILKLEFTWYPDLVHSAFLTATGVLVLVSFYKCYVEGNEYDPTKTMPFGMNFGSDYWLRDISIRNSGDLIHKPLSSEKLDKVSAAYQRNDATLSTMLDAGVGDRAHWHNARLSILVIYVCMTALILAVNTPKAWAVLPYLLMAVTFQMQIILCVTYVGNSNWPLTSIWVRLPVSDKTSLLKLMCTNIARNVITTFLLACAMCVVFTLMTQRWDVLGQVSLSSLAVTLQGIALNLLFGRFRTLGFLITIVATASWLIGMGWVFRPFTENLWQFSAGLFVTATLTFLLVVPWWYRGFYRRREYSLMPAV